MTDDPLPYSPFSHLLGRAGQLLLTHMFLIVDIMPTLNWQKSYMFSLNLKENNILGTNIV